MNTTATGTPYVLAPAPFTVDVGGTTRPSVASPLAGRHLYTPSGDESFTCSAAVLVGGTPYETVSNGTSKPVQAPAGSRITRCSRGTPTDFARWAIRVKATSQGPASVRLRDALTLTHDASDDEVNAELESLPCSAACDACRHDEDVDNRSHFACQAYHPAWDIAEEIGLADVVLTRYGWTWQL